MATNMCLATFCIFIRLFFLMIVYIKFCFYEKDQRQKNMQNIWGEIMNKIQKFLTIWQKKSQNPKKNLQ
jgi:hypothetical protein